jgi:hypothetical protein
MTREDAANKWCPLARVSAFYGDHSLSDPNQSGANASCVSTGCAMWRTVQTPPEEMTGYCGLAGTPISIRNQA